MSETFTLGVDLDGVVADYEARMRQITAAVKGVPIESIPVATTWSFVESGWPFDDEDDFYTTHGTAVLDHDLYRTLAPMPGASSALWRMSDAGVRIRIVTHRLVTNFIHGRVVRDTVDWLDENKIPFRDICFVKDKADIFGCDLYIDDAPMNIRAIRERHGQDAATVFDQAYNRDLPGPRVRDWADVVSLVQSKSGIDIASVPERDVALAH